NMNPALVREMYSQAVDVTGAVNASGVQKDLDFFLQQGWVTGQIKASDVIDMSFAQKASAELGPYQRKSPCRFSPSLPKKQDTQTWSRSRGSSSRCSSAATARPSSICTAAPASPPTFPSSTSSRASGALSLRRVLVLENRRCPTGSTAWTTSPTSIWN